MAFSLLDPEEFQDHFDNLDSLQQQAKLQYEKAAYVQSLEKIKESK